MQPDDMEKLLSQVIEPQVIEPELVPADDEEEEPDMDMALYNDDLVNKTWSYVSETPDYQAFMSEAQRAILTGEIPLEMTLVRPLGLGTDWLVYLSHWVVSDVLNKAFLFNWDLGREGFETRKNDVTKKLEAFVWGTMVIQGERASIRIPWFAGHKINQNPNNVLAHAFESALSKAITKCGERLGIGRIFKDGRIKEKALIFHGKAKEPTRYQMQELRTLLQVSKDEEILSALEQRGIHAERWEFGSRMRIDALTAGVRRNRLGL